MLFALQVDPETGLIDPYAEECPPGYVMTSTGCRDATYGPTADQPEVCPEGYYYGSTPGRCERIDSGVPYGPDLCPGGYHQDGANCVPDPPSATAYGPKDESHAPAITMATAGASRAGLIALGALLLAGGGVALAVAVQRQRASAA